MECRGASTLTHNPIGGSSMAVDVKSIFASKTFWFAVLYGVINLAGLLGFADFTPSSDVAEIVGVLVSAGAILLRLVTDTPVSLTGN